MTTCRRFDGRLTRAHVERQLGQQLQTAPPSKVAAAKVAPNGEDIDIETDIRQGLGDAFQQLFSHYAQALPAEIVATANASGDRKRDRDESDDYEDTQEVRINMARVYAEVNQNMPRAYWDYDSVNISEDPSLTTQKRDKLGMGTTNQIK